MESHTTTFSPLEEPGDAISTHADAHVHAHASEAPQIQQHGSSDLILTFAENQRFWVQEECPRKLHGLTHSPIQSTLPPFSLAPSTHPDTADQSF